MNKELNKAIQEAAIEVGIARCTVPAGIEAIIAKHLLPIFSAQEAQAAAMKEALHHLIITYRNHMAGAIPSHEWRDECDKVSELLKSNSAGASLLAELERLRKETAIKPDAAENTTDNPRSYVAWKSRAEAAETYVKELESLLTNKFGEDWRRFL